MDFNDVLGRSVRDARELKLRTLDLPHVVTCKVDGWDTQADLGDEVARRNDEI